MLVIVLPAGFFEKVDSKLDTAFRKVAASLSDDFRFGQAFDEEILKKYDLKE